MSKDKRLSSADAGNAREAIKKDMAAYAEANAGTELDLDPALERAGIEHLLESEAAENEQEYIDVAELTVDEILAMTPEEKKQLADELSAEQVKQLWERREELDKEAFYLMIFSLLTCPGASTGSKYPGFCPFSGRQSDAYVSGGVDSWLDGCYRLDIHHSIAKDLVELAMRVGAGTRSFSITSDDGGYLFSHDERFYVAHPDLGDHDNYLFVDVTDNVGVMEEEVAEGERRYERILKDEMQHFSGKNIEIEFNIETPENARAIKLSVREKARETLTERKAS